MKQGCHPATIGPYPVTGVLGHGGMGTVYRALAPDTGQTVALKLLSPSEPLRETLGMAALRELFAAEAATMSGLRHQNIVAVLAAGQDDQGRPFYAMEHFCANLGMLIGEHYLVDEPCRRVPPDKAVAYGCQILAGLQCMHDAGVIHRDIKPFNMLLSAADTVKIGDFGMARRLREKTFPARNMHIGSPYYTAPEQLGNPEDADARADLYSAAVLLYRMLTGELPAMKGFLLSQVNPLYDPAWDVFFAKALSWRPDQRFQDAAGMAMALRDLELHWDLAHGPDRNRATGMPRPLRSSPITITGDKARSAFAVDRLWQPLSPSRPRFTSANVDTVIDATTGLIWQRHPSSHPVDRPTAAELIKVLNETRFAGRDTWRLPTVNELLTLAREQTLPPAGDSTPIPDSRDWFWSCDLRSAATSWYVNTCVGYAGWQDNHCRFTVRAVASPH
ncbi:MAG: protein kinase domain-containing protein [Desulfobulbaceae bacterium]